MYPMSNLVETLFKVHPIVLSIIWSKNKKNEHFVKRKPHVLSQINGLQLVSKRGAELKVVVMVVVCTLLLGERKARPYMRER